MLLLISKVDPVIITHCAEVIDTPTAIVELRHEVQIQISIEFIERDIPVDGKVMVDFIECRQQLGLCGMEISF